MKKLFVVPFLFLALAAQSQAIINSWLLNANGQLASQYAPNNTNPQTWTFTNMTDSANILKVCYNADTVWLRCQGLTDSMGKWQNPGSAVAQNYTFRFPRQPQPATGTHTASPMLGAIGVLLNGVPIFGLSNANSWTGSTNANPQQGGEGIWNVEVGKSEGFVLDAAFGAHPQQQGAYHSHTTPYRLYQSTPTTQHSPLVGFAFDGYPVYGPYAYSSPMDNASGIIRMKSGYSLRSITTRTTLPDGSTASQAGPAVSATYPLGTYCEDYAWSAANGGDLDEYNGRFCVTPEYPAGTYAYFVTVDAAGAAAFPYYIGFRYYGVPDAGNIAMGPNGNGLSIPANGLTCLTPVSTGISSFGSNKSELQLYPNPTGDVVTLLSNGHPYTQLSVFNAVGQKIYSAAISGQENHGFSLPAAGVYFVRCENRATGAAAVQRVVRE